MDKYHSNIKHIQHHSAQHSVNNQSVITDHGCLTCVEQVVSLAPGEHTHSLLYTHAQGLVGWWRSLSWRQIIWSPLSKLSSLVGSLFCHIMWLSFTSVSNKPHHPSVRSSTIPWHSICLPKFRVPFVLWWYWQVQVVTLLCYPSSILPSLHIQPLTQAPAHRSKNPNLY